VPEAALTADPDALTGALGRLHGMGVAEVLLTLGADGALLSTARGGLWSARPPAIVVRSTVGAGDSSLAGYVLADLAGEHDGDRLAAAVAYGSASASLPGSAVPTPAQVDRSQVRVTAGFPGTSSTPYAAPVPAAGRDAR
jgi:1-phosphofructokinase